MARTDIDICSSTTRISHAYTSVGNSLEIRLLRMHHGQSSSGQHQQPTAGPFVLRYEGKYEAMPPPQRWIARAVPLQGTVQRSIRRGCVTFPCEIKLERACKQAFHGNSIRLPPRRLPGTLPAGFHCWLGSAVNEQRALILRRSLNIVQNFVDEKKTEIECWRRILSEQIYKSFPGLGWCRILLGKRLL